MDKHIPKYLRRKIPAQMIPKSRIFEVQPTSGVLDPGEKANVQVKFMPKEEVSLKKYEPLWRSSFLVLFETEAQACLILIPPILWMACPSSSPICCEPSGLLPKAKSNIQTFSAVWYISDSPPLYLQAVYL